jgi:hypothetical protein
MNMNKIKVGAKIKVNAENPTTAHTLVRSPDIAFGSSGERTEDYILHSTPRLTATS